MEFLIGVISRISDIWLNSFLKNVSKFGQHSVALKRFPWKTTAF